MPDAVDRRFADLTVRIDRTLCIGSGNCMKAGPDLFEFDEERICAFRPAAPGHDRDHVLESCRVCPVGALLAFAEDGTQLVP